MTTSRSLRRSLAAAAVAATVSFAAAPAVAAEDAEATEEGAEEAATTEEPAGKMTMAETSRDRVGLIFLGALGAMAVGGGVTMVRQLGGKRPQADGEFRWR